MSEEVLRMSLKWENYDTVMGIIQAAEKPETREAMLTELAYQNPYLSAKIVMEATKNNQEEEKEKLLRVINKRLKIVTNLLSRKLLLLALLELEENEQFQVVDKSGVDFRKIKTIRYFIDRLILKQQLVLIRFLATYQDGVSVKSAVNMIMNRCDGKIPSDETESTVDIAKTLLQNRKLGDAYRLLKAIGIDRDFSQALGVSREELLQSIESKGPFLSEDEVEFLFNLKYGLREETANESDIWTAIYQETQEIADVSINRLIKRYVKRGVFSQETLLHILRWRGLSDEDCNQCLSDRSCVLRLLTPGYEECMYKEPFYSLLKDERKIMDLLEDKSFDNSYEFSEDKKLCVNTDKDATEEEQEYFNQCVENFSSAKNLVRVYFNTPLKYTVNLEHLIEAIIKRFDYSETDIRYLLRSYTFKGKVCRLNENSVSVRAYNVWTSLPCRLSNLARSETQETQSLSKGDIIYFKFDYMAADSRKVNVCLPATSLEEMKELEARSLDFSD